MFSRIKRKFNEETEEKEETKEKDISSKQLNIIMPKDDDELRLVGLFGEVEENKIALLVAALIDLADKAEVEVPKNPDDPDSETEIVVEPIDFIISTHGGNADDMFALYDIMRVIKDRCDIQTFGLGKVMSAGVLLLAAGTKGKRKIGKNCRVMIHSVVAGSAGSFHNLENEMEEIRFTQDAYLRALADESNMTYTQLKKMIDKKVNVYLSAEEAVKMGIADIIV
jgi:ATP-dependent Clp endopeptidase proteolytic subunit ClpP